MDYPVEGGCTCGRVRYRMLTRPLVVHCCHCRWCQRETGASAALEGIARGEVAVAEGRVVTHAQAKDRLARWQK